MSAPADAQKPSPAAAPESPTTARPLEMDDDDVQESGQLDTSASAGADARTTASSDMPPPKPPRPMTEQQKHVMMLKDAFPSVEESVIKAILTASRGQLEPAFNALLEMTDPDAAKEYEEQPPQQPPRPAQQPLGASANPMTQLEADELYARQLAEHYENVGAYEERTANRGQEDGYGRPQPQGTGTQQEYGKDHSFFDDELPVIKENLRKGFRETQTMFNDWFNNMKKRIDGDVEDPNYHDDGPRPGHGRMGRRPGEPRRRSNDYDRYDADPQLLADDFAGMKFHNDGTPARDQRPGGMGNPDVFMPPAKTASPGPRKVAFKEHVEDIDDIYEGGPAKKMPKDAPPPGKASKWQPLSTVEPNPIADNDPFSLGDSDDEKEAKDKASTKAKQGDVQAATAEAMAESLVDSAPKAEVDGKKS